MDSNARFAVIHAIHPVDRETSRDKLARLLCGWLGGPKLCSEKYGSIRIPCAHAHLAITGSKMNQWLTCTDESVAEQPFAPEFRRYLMKQLMVPAAAARKRYAATRHTSQ